MQSHRLDTWLREISDAKNDLLLPEMVVDEGTRRLYELYDTSMRACRAVDFDDLLLLTYRLFEERPAIAAFYRRQYRYVVIDEAQDLNEAQYRVLCALCGKEYTNVMLVGDPKQAIFMWNGAHPKYLDLFVKDFSATTIELQENFRSASRVIDAAKALNSQYSVGGAFPVRGVVEIRECATVDDEAEFVIRRITELIDQGHPDIEGKLAPESFAVLGRNKFVLAKIEEGLEREQIAFYKKVSAGSVESASDLVAEFELALRVLANPLDRLHVGMLAQRWSSGKTADDIYQNADLRSLTGLDVIQLLGEKATGGAYKSVLESIAELDWTPEDIKLMRSLDVLGRVAAELDDNTRMLVEKDLQEWKKHWNYYVRTEPGGLHSAASFLSQVALGTTQQAKQEGVALLTVHSAKGMEFDVVFMVGMNQGTFPDYRARGAALEEERRNAFVAVTRSRRLLFLTYPKVRLMPWGDMKYQAPSEFVNEIKAKTRQN
jgi:DNA helicase-2/ATP-dependent DNA helicase PcrA